MKHAEVIFEPGSKSVLSYDDEAELKNFLKNHVDRAKAGNEGGPTGHPAERVSKVLLYDRHPAEWGVGGRLATDRVNSLVQGMAQDNTVDAHQLIAALRDELSPVYPQDQGRHESDYKMSPTGELDLGFLNAGGTPEAGAQ